jgi:hypothetical protein
MMMQEPSIPESSFSIVSQLDSVVLQKSDVINQLEMKNAQLEWQLRKSNIQLSDLTEKYMV